MISNELFEEVIEISKKDKLIDKMFVCKLVREILSNTDDITRNKFKYFAFINSKDYLGRTNPDVAYILFSFNECCRFNNSLKIPTLEKNINIISTILHEFEHLKEYSKEKKGGFEGNLIYISNFANSLADTKTNLDRYFTNPSEKIAKAQSWKELLKIVKQYPNFKIDHEGTYNYINNMYIESLKQGYEKKQDGTYNIPIIDFMKSINRLSLGREMFKLIPVEEKKNYSNLSLEQRFMYGFKITNDDMKKLDSKKLIMKR